MSKIIEFPAIQESSPTASAGVSPLNPFDSKILGARAIKERQLDYTDGWTRAREVWTYASADAPIFTFIVEGNFTDRYQGGMRIKLTQNASGTETTSYFIIVGSSFSAPVTTIKVYGGTDYTLQNQLITDPYYSFFKAPVGFLTDPTKWSQITTSTSLVTEASPSQSTFYNLGSLSLDIPIGAWQVNYEVVAGHQSSDTSTDIELEVALSTSTSSVSDNELYSFYFLQGASTSSHIIQLSFARTKYLTISTKTPYYLITRSTNSSLDSLNFFGNYSTTTIRATCGYL